LVERKVESKIRKRLDQLYDDLVTEGFNKEDVEDLINDVEADLISELDKFEEEG